MTDDTNAMSTADAFPVPGTASTTAAETAEPGETAATAATAAAETTAEITAGPAATPSTDVPAGAAPPTAAETTAAGIAATTAAMGAPITAAEASPIAVVAPRQGFSAAVAGRRLLRFVFAGALLAGGIYLGYQTFLQNRPAPAIVGDPAVFDSTTPAVVEDLAAAIGADDANAIRVALTAEMFSSYTSDMERFGISRIGSVETLGTYTDGARTATALVILGQTVDGNPFTINLVVIAQDGQIVRLR